MDLSAQTINTLAMNASTIDSAFVQNIQGQWDERILGFVRALVKANPKGFEKLSVKLQQLQIVLDTALIHKIIDTLIAQLHLPPQARAVISIFLEDTHVQSLLKELEQTTTAQRSRLLRAVHCMMDHLQIFSAGTVAQQFLRCILTVMLQQGAQAGAKYLKEWFFVDQKSEIVAIIDYMAHSCNLADTILHGGVRYMDCLELFFLCTNLIIENTMPLFLPYDKGLVRDVHAILLIASVCKESPHAFYDVVFAEQIDAFFLSDAQDTPYLELFFKESVSLCSNKPSQHIFLSTLTQRIPALLDLHNLPSNDTMQEILSIIYQDLLRQDQHHSGRIRAAALQLLTLGFSHRSAFATSNGSFMPLVNTDVIKADLIHSQSLLDFFRRQPAPEQSAFTAEIIGLMLRYTKLTRQTDNTAVATAASIDPTLRYQISHPWQKTAPLFQQFQKRLASTAGLHDHWP